MESMKSGSANHSHHPNKVAINSLETDSNKQTITSNVSGSTLNNNNKSSENNQQQQQQQQSATESKENNFEYDDNEWDVGGIGDLIKDLDNDIKKTSETGSQNVNSTSEQSSSSSGSSSSSSTSSNSRSSSSSPSSLSTPSSTSTVSAQLNQHSQSIGSTSTIQSNRLIEHETKSKKDSTDTDKSIKLKSVQASTSSSIDKIQAKNPSIASTKPSTQHQSNKQKQQQQSTLSDQEISKKSTQKSSTSISNTATDLVASDKNSSTNIGNMSSNTAGQTTGKAGKVADHHATLDKGLKMKIKRTKPGTKTSEAKHEIVKAEQNGSLSGADDINPLNTPNSGSGNKKMSLQQQNQQSPVLQQSQTNLNQSQTNSSSQQLSSSPALTSTPNTSQTNKRTNSSHRRDKTRDKTSYSQRDKASSNSSASVNNNSNPNNTDIHNSSASNSDRNYNCHEINATLSSTPSKTEHDLLGSKHYGTPIDNDLSQRISSAALQTNTNNISNSNVISSALNSSSANAFGSNTNLSGSISSSKTPNAPGPPQIDGKLSYSTTIMSHIQQLPQPNFQSNNITGTLNSQSKSASSSKLSIAPASPQIDSKMGILSNGEESTSPPPTKKIKCEPKDMVDVCVGTSVGTITEPDCLGPCEPGTSVTLEGIVWHETEGGVLVVNVTWRGKTYVGTLLDCTKHDWAPPRFCDSPTEELDSRTPKGRAKRGRSAAQQPTNDLSNFTETRSSVHSKLRNASAKGRASRTSTSSTTNTTNTTTTITASNAGINSTNSSSLTASPPESFLPVNARRAEKRKSKDDSPPPSFNGSDSNGSNSGSATNSDLNVQIPKKVKTTTPCAISPVLLECPEQDCSKKYKHANGLKYHQSHAHGAGSMDEDSQQLPESPRDSQQLAESPPPIQKHAANIHSSLLPSSRSSLSSFESIVASGFSEIAPPVQPEPGIDAANAVEQSNAGTNSVQISSTVQRSRTPTPLLETKPSSVPVSTIPESNQTSQSATSEPNVLPLVGQTQPANNSNSIQTSKNESQAKASTPGPQAVSMVKPQKKQRKEGTNDFDNTSRDRDDVQSPAYSDISDDSTPVAESEISGMFKDKNQAVKHPADILPKKVGETTLPPQSSQMGYGIYHFCEFPQTQPTPSATANEHANGKQAAPQPVPTSIPGSIQDYKGVAPATVSSVTTPVTAPEITSRPMHQHPGAPPPMSQANKFLGNYYPYNYIPPGYPYNIDPNYGPVSMVSDDGKLPAPQPMIKEERLKESPSPNENPKSQLQNVPAKMVKTEPGIGKDVKQSQPLPPPHESHPKDLNTSPMGPYSSMFQRQPLNVPPPQHMREEEVRRYYGMYPDQRRPGIPSGSMPQNIKDEPQSPSQPSSQGQTHRDREKERDRNDHSQPKNLKSSGHSTPQQQKQPPKESKNDDKETTKPKQDIGQKPTFESQGPPPPPTSQFYAIHPPYMGASPFGFEPSAMYRNMMVPYNSSPYHLQMSRFHAPEDLSRNTNPKALDILQHQAAQYYNPHKIHELSERALKSPTGIGGMGSNSQSQHPASQPPVSQQSAQQPPNSMNQGMNPNVPSSGPGHANLQTPPTSMPSTTGAKSGPPSASQPTNLSGSVGDMPPNKEGSSSERSPPPAMRHIHTHHHTHVGVGLGYPMYPAAYSAAVLTPPQAAVAVINPFPPGPTK